MLITANPQRECSDQAGISPIGGGRVVLPHQNMFHNEVYEQPSRVRNAPPVVALTPPCKGGQKADVTRARQRR